MKKKTFLTGTVNRKTKDLSKSLINQNLGAQQSIYFRRGAVLLVGYKQKPTRKPVYLITTGCHTEDKLIQSRCGLQAVKPIVIHKYNMSMGGVDNSDKSIYHLPCSRATKRYWKKIFTNFLDIALHKAYLLYSRNTEKPLERKEFMVNIVENLSKNGNNVLTNQPPSAQAQEDIPHMI